jgi:hypothetical protein
MYCHYLRTFSLPTELREIGHNAFKECKRLVALDLTPSLKVIRSGSFMKVGLGTLNAPDSVKLIEANSFVGGDFANFRVPPLITKVDMQIFHRVDCIVSIELSEEVEQINKSKMRMAFFHLRNIALPLGSTVDEEIYLRGAMLLKYQYVIWCMICSTGSMHYQCISYATTICIETLKL